MFAHRFFAARYFAERYFPPIVQDTSNGGRLVGRELPQAVKVRIRDTARANIERNNTARTKVKRGN